MFSKIKVASGLLCVLAAFCLLQRVVNRTTQAPQAGNAAYAVARW